MLSLIYGPTLSYICNYWKDHSFDYMDLCWQRDSKEFFQYHNLEASILWHSAFLIVQLSYPYMTTRKTIALIIQTFVGEVVSLLFSILSRFVGAFFPRSKILLISWLQSPFTVILKHRK